MPLLTFAYAFLSLAVALAATAVYVLVQAWVASALGILVEQVQVGFGPTLWQRKIGHTLYRWALWPLGGFTKFRGLDDDELQRPPLPEGFVRFQEASPLGRLAVALSGPMSNLVIGMAVLMIPVYTSDSHLAVGENKSQLLRPSAIPGLTQSEGKPSIESQLRLARDSGGEFLLRTCTLRSLSGWGGILAFFYTTGVAGTASLQAWTSLAGVMLVTLGLGNLLPIPCLNGWQALEFIYELILRQPVPTTISVWSRIVGLLILVTGCPFRWVLLDAQWIIGFFW